MTNTKSRKYSFHVRRPVDFDTFWRTVMEQLAVIPLRTELHPDLLRSSEDVEVYQVFYDSLDHIRVAGWYCRPRQRDETIPALLLTPGYIMEPPLPKDWARKGYAILSVAPRGKLRSHWQFNPGYPGLLTHNIVDRHTYGYRGFYADAWRGIDFLLSRDEVDPSRIGVIGHSQGGGLAISTAAMRPEVAVASSIAPYLCAIMEASRLTDSYPYQEITDYLHLHPERRHSVEETLTYFDIMNFASKVHCPIIVGIGNQDNICPPITGLAVFDKLGSNQKELHTYDGFGHDAAVFQGHGKLVDEFLRKHLSTDS